jgi:hypothetical protein
MTIRIVKSPPASPHFYHVECGDEIDEGIPVGRLVTRDDD